MVKKLGVLLFFLLFILSLPSEVKAHFGGIPALKINGKFTSPYTLQNISIGDNYLPSDSAPENYLVNKPIIFEVDKSKLPFPEDIIKQAKYSWDFGDGTKATGIKISHTYKKIGSHELVLTIDFGDLSRYGFSPQDPSLNPPQTVMIHILPNASYKLPKAIITIDGKAIIDPIKDKFPTSYKEKIGPFTFGKSFTFSAANSITASSKKVSYLWDFGDSSVEKQSIAKSLIVKHAYVENYWMREPSLRIVDENGFISDTFASMENNEKNFNSEERYPINIEMVKQIGIGFIIFIFVLITFFGYLKLRKK